MVEHELDAQQHHNVWDRSLEPALVVRSGDLVHMETMEGSGGQIPPGTPAEIFERLDWDRVYPLTGPVAVEGAEPGDALEIEVLSVRTSDWGWCGIIPGYGLLPEDFDSAYIRHFDLRNGRCAPLTDSVHVPINPYCGTMGVALDEPGQIPVLPPHAGGGNIDTRHLTAGARLFLPVLVPGGLFSIGDGHAAQGDGEVCVSAIECGLQISVRFTLHRARPLPGGIHFRTPPGFLQPLSDARGYHAVQAVGPDLYENAQTAVRGLIEWVGDTYGLAPEDAYILCSLAADLHISQIVDQPNLGVSAYLSLAVFDHC